jgi:hypothetical protein
VRTLLQQGIDADKWVSGNAVAFKLVSETIVTQNDSCRFAANENGSYNEAVLEVWYSEEAYADEDECDPGSGIGHYDVFRPNPPSEIYVGNKYTEVGLTHIFRYDASPVTWSANLLGTTPPYNLFPAAPAAGDMIYFGSTTTPDIDGGAFHSLVFELSDWFTADLGSIVQFEYYRGAPASAWSSFNSSPTWPAMQRGGIASPVAWSDRYFDSGNARTGPRSIHWEGPYHSSGGSWEPNTVNGVTGWWIRARMTAYTGGQVTVSKHPYTITWPNVSIGSEDLGGDLSALSRVRFFAASYSGTPIYRILAGLRSRYPDRGTEPGFTAFIPLQDKFLPQSVAEILKVSAGSSWINHPGASNGRILQHNPAVDTDEVVGYVKLKTGAYRGAYRAFLRVSQVGTPIDFSARLEIWSAIDDEVKIVTPTVSVAEVATTDNPNFLLLDFGEVFIPPSNSGVDDEEGITYVYIYARSTSGTPNLLFESLILMPSDEWMGEAFNTIQGATGSLGDYMEYYSMDSLSDFREDYQARLGNLYSATTPPSGHRGALIKGRATGSLAVPSNTDFDLWMLTMGIASYGPYVYHSEPYMDTKPRLEVLERYQGLRGNK